MDNYDALIRTAERLGFHDDVAHWTAEREKARAEQPAQLEDSDD